MRPWLSLLIILLPAISTAADRPNILLLMAEDLSSRIGAYDDAVAHTPNIDRLAREGVRYTNAFTAAGVCAPSRAAIITGMHQESIGAQHMRSYTSGPADYRAVPPADVKAFPELLRASGYYTFNRNKLDYQFSHVRSGTGPFTIWDDDDSGDVNFDEISKQQPFFGYINFIGTHESGLFYKDVFPTGIAQIYTQMKQALIHRHTQDLISPDDVEVPPYYPDTPLVRKDIARQYNNLITVDRQVGEVLDALEKSGQADNTIVIWTTDHGDGLPRAKRELYDSGIKVPMIIRWPERYKPAGIEAGGVSDRLISLIDLAPSFLSLAEAKPAPFMHGVPFAGKAEVAERQYVYASRDRIGDRPDRQRAIRDKRFKYIRSYDLQPGAFHLAYRDNLDSMQELWRLFEAGQLNDVQMQWFSPRPEEMLFDTHNDPHEINNLASNPAYTEELSRLREAFEEHHQQVVDLSEDSEVKMAEHFWPGGEQPQTAVPELLRQDGSVVIRCASRGASIGYRVNGGRWRLYTDIINVAGGDRIEAKAVRYGWGESEVVELNL